MEENTTYSKGWIILHAIALTAILLLFSRSFPQKARVAILPQGINQTLSLPANSLN